MRARQMGARIVNVALGRVGYELRVVNKNASSGREWWSRGGAVVTRNVRDKVLVAGMPAVVKKSFV